MNKVVRCAHCKEPIEGKPLVKAGKSYCSEACAFEGTQRPGPMVCGHDNPGVGSRRK